MKTPPVKNFLDSHRKAGANEAVSVQMGDMSLRIDYDAEGLIHHIARVNESGLPLGRELKLEFKNKIFTFVRKGGMTGEYWSNGKSAMAAHFEDADPVVIKEISFEDWIDECVNRMLEEKE